MKAKWEKKKNSTEYEMTKAIGRGDAEKVTEILDSLCTSGRAWSIPACDARKFLNSRKKRR